MGGGGEGLVDVDFLDEELCAAELVCEVVGVFSVFYFSFELLEVVLSFYEFGAEGVVSLFLLVVLNGGFLID